jgi:NADH-quinone oxidoreductase subunit N
MGAFAIVIMLRSEGFQGEDIEDYIGLSKSNPTAAALMLVFMFSLTGIPPTAGFIGKFYVIMEVINAGHTYLAVVAVVFSAVSAFFYLRIVMYMFMKDPKEEVVLTSSPSMSFALALTSMMVIIIGVFPAVLLNLVRFSMP